MSWGNSVWGGLGLMVGLVLAVLVVGYFLALPPQWAWLGIVIVLTIFVALLGLANHGSLLGALVDERNKYSLSRLQVIVWTVVVLSAITALGFARLRTVTGDAFAIQVPEELWIAIGVTATALVGTPIIRSVKANSRKLGEPLETVGTLNQLGIPVIAVDDPQLLIHTRGLIVVNPTPAQATWLDLFRGEETGNAAALDIGKVQMFYFSVLVVFVYGVAVWTSFSGVLPQDLPLLTPALVTLLAISNGTYLANKAAPHSTT